MDIKPSNIEFQPRTVTKHFSDPQAFKQELTVYQRKLPFIPTLIDYRDPAWICMERVAGIPYLDCDITEKEVSLLAETIALFHQSTYKEGFCLCHWDNQPRNILYDGSLFYLIDFSESSIASPEDDLTHLLLFWASDFPPARMEILSQAFIGSYQKHYKLDIDRWQSSLERSIERFDERRAKHLRTNQHISIVEIEINRQLISDLFN